MAGAWLRWGLLLWAGLLASSAHGRVRRITYVVRPGPGLAAGALPLGGPPRPRTFNVALNARYSRSPAGRSTPSPAVTRRPPRSPNRAGKRCAPRCRRRPRAAGARGCRFTRSSSCRGSMSVVGSAVMAGVRPLAPRGAPNQAVFRRVRMEGCVSDLSSVCVNQGPRAKPVRRQLPRTPRPQSLEGRVLRPLPPGSLLSKPQSALHLRRRTRYQESVPWPR